MPTTNRPINIRLHIFRILTLFIFCISASAAAQDVKTVVVEDTYRVVGNMTLDQAKAEAIRQAQIKAIADEFGTVIGEASVSRSTINGSEQRELFNSVGLSNVNGEWLQTIGKPEVKPVPTNDGQLELHVKIKGKIREIKRTKPQFECSILKNGITNAHQSKEFRNGDKMFIKFQSAVDGYIAIFSQEDSVRCLVPTIEAPNGTFAVKANKETILFTSPKEQIEMYCTMPNELDVIYILFSPNPIYPPVCHTIDDGGLAVYTDAEFQKWLTSVRTKDTDMQYDIKYITIIE